MSSCRADRPGWSPKTIRCSSCRHPTPCHHCQNPIAPGPRPTRARQRLRSLQGYACACTFLEGEQENAGGNGSVPGSRSSCSRHAASEEDFQSYFWQQPLAQLAWATALPAWGLVLARPAPPVQAGGVALGSMFPGNGERAVAPTVGNAAAGPSRQLRNSDTKSPRSNGLASV